jgi:hypothetical protein
MENGEGIMENDRMGGAWREGIMMVAGVSLREAKRRGYPAGVGFLHGLLRFARNDGGGGVARRENGE